MIVHHLTPFSVEKNLGKAYNEAMSLIPDGDVACIRDLDTMFLTPDAGEIVFNYAYQNPGAVMTCFTNRIHQLSKEQGLPLIDHRNGSDISNHINTANKHKESLYQTTELTGPISGFLMLIPKSVWLTCPFEENGLLGIDTAFYKRYRAQGGKVLRMDGLYIWHTYRLGRDIKDVSHLKV